MLQKPKLLYFNAMVSLFNSDQEWVDTQLPENIHLTKTPCTGESTRFTCSTLFRACGRGHDQRLSA
jgi:hypothetical protein